MTLRALVRVTAPKGVVPPTTPPKLMSPRVPAVIPKVLAGALPSPFTVPLNDTAAPVKKSGSLPLVVSTVVASLRIVLPAKVMAEPALI